MRELWTRIDLTPLPNGRVRAQFETNDDDGLPGEVVQLELMHSSFETALKFYGKSRVDFYGHEIIVKVGGEKL
jgi:hypothetical protein